MTVAIICIVSFAAVALHNHYKAVEKRKAERKAKHVKQMQEIAKAIEHLEKTRSVLANRKNAQEPYWF